MISWNEGKNKQLVIWLLIYVTKENWFPSSTVLTSISSNCFFSSWVKLNEGQQIQHFRYVNLHFSYRSSLRILLWEIRHWSRISKIHFSCSGNYMHDLIFFFFFFFFFACCCCDINNIKECRWLPGKKFKVVKSVVKFCLKDSEAEL